MARQKMVFRSSIEVEYHALAHAIVELVWIKNLLREANICLAQPPPLLCDNLGTTYVCKNLVFHLKMKHLALDYFLSVIWYS